MTAHRDEAYHMQVQSTHGSGKAETTTIDHKSLGACESGQKAGVPIGM
jgi:hypothetical protein